MENSSPEKYCHKLVDLIKRLQEASNRLGPDAWVQWYILDDCEHALKGSQLETVHEFNALNEQWVEITVEPLRHTDAE